MSARDNILARLRQSPSVTVEAPDVKQWAKQRQLNETIPQNITRLREALEAAHADVHLTDIQSWPKKLLEIIEAKNIHSLLIGANMELDFPAPTSCQLFRYNQNIENWRDLLFTGIDASLTWAKSAIAATGTLIIWPDSSEPRLMSLVPSIHVVLLDATNIHANFSTAIEVENWSNTIPTNALLISGPSKTADIQQTLAYGAHGPRELILLILQQKGSET